MSSSEHIERIPLCDLDRDRDRLTLVADLVAMANSGGGTVAIGLKKSGQPVGLGPELAAKLSAVAGRVLDGAGA